MKGLILYKLLNFRFIEFMKFGNYLIHFNPLLRNVVKWSDTLVSPFYDIAK